MFTFQITVQIMLQIMWKKSAEVGSSSRNVRAGGEGSSKRFANEQIMERRRGKRKSRVNKLPGNGECSYLLC